MDNLTLAFKMYDSIIFFWNFFIPGAIAITGWVFASEDRWPLGKRIAVAFSYSGSTLVNLVGLWRSYRALDNILDALRSAPTPTTLNPAVFQATVDRLELGPWWVTMVFHLVVDAIVLYFVLHTAARTRTARPKK
jgi:hypothetical protein